MPDKAKHRRHASSPEDRIGLHYRSLKKRWDFGHYSSGDLFMFLARQWKRPVREIKRIVGYRSDVNHPGEGE